MLFLTLLIFLAPVNSQYLNLTENIGNILGNPCTDKNHIVLAPGVLTAGGTSRACVSRFYPEGSARLLLTLLTEDRQTTTASRELPPGDGGCLDIDVPQLPNTKADLIVNIRYSEVQCVWERRLSLRVSNGRVLVVQAERARYRPGDTVRARVLVLKPDLAPSHSLIEEIWMEGPRGAWEGTRVVQWLRVRTRLGLAQLQYQLDKHAPPGKWTLRAKLGDGSQGSAVFWVGNYELPPFQLSVRHAPRVLRTSERLSWIVCVRYPWSEAVEGMLVIRLRGAGGGGTGVRTAVQLRAPKACHRHAVAAKRVGLHSRNPPDVLVADFSFQEDGTRIWQNTTVVSQVVEKPITLEFLTKHRAVISPGLPYKLKVKATRWDDKPATGEHIRVCRYPALQPAELVRQERDEATSSVTSNHLCTQGETDSNGVARVMFAPVHDEAAFYKFEAQLQNDSSTTASLTVRVRRGSLQAALGPLRVDPHSTRTLVPLYINAHVTSPLTVHFVVITRGGIIYRWGATTQCPTSNSGEQIHTAQRNGKCNANYYGYNQELHAQDEHLDNYDDIDQRRNPQLKRPKRGVRRSKSLDITHANTEENPNQLNDFSKSQSKRRHDQNTSQNSSITGNANIEAAVPIPISVFNTEREHINAQNRPENYMNTFQKLHYHNQWNRSVKNTPTSSWNPKTQRITNRNARTSQYTNIDKIDQYWTNPATNNVDSQKNNTVVTSDALLERKLKVLLPIRVSHQMCPESHLIAYFYYNGELVSASKHFEMDECFANKVEATWLSRQVQPGSMVSLQISTPGPAFCALTVLDTAAKWIQPPPTTRELLMNSLRKLIDSHRNLTEYDAAGECFLNYDTPAAPTSSIELTTTWLAAAGVRLLGGEAPRQALRRCEVTHAAMLTEDSAPRTDFSEAWLWRLLPIGANGTGVATARAPDSITRFEAGATCVSRNGIAVTSPAILQVFREFFIHADSPKRLRRGDSTIIRYRIFNYLYEPLSVQIQVLTDPHIEAFTELVETACIAARSSIARRAHIKARVASPARLSIRAKAVNDANCPNVTSTTSVSDEVIIRIDVEPEGIPTSEQKSVLLCGNGSSTDLSTSSVSWTWEQVDMVSGTETLSVWTVGDVTGPLLADADSLVQIPRGCGEQNMAQLATNLLALKHLDPTSIAAFTAREHVARGFTRQLQYIHPSGGFSAFGPSDAGSSTWLTAFAVRHMRRAHQLLWPNLQVPPALIRAERWLLNQQMENGCFRNEGQVFHRELRGGLNEEGEIASVALTAYVITSLLESTTPLPYRVLQNTLSCLRALPPIKSQTPTRVYAHALLSYAYMALEKYEQDLRKTNRLNLIRSMGLEQDEGIRQVLELLKVAKRSSGYVWWEASSLSTTIEATSYALLAIRSSPETVLSRGGASDATAAKRWLAAHRNVNGGFVSTQDTLVALEALTAWSSSTPPTNLNVTVRSNKVAQSVTLQPGSKIPDIINLRPGEKLNVNVEGTGCALVQATRSYNTLSPPPNQEKLLSVQVAVHTDGTFDCDDDQISCFCAAVVEACVMWSGRFPEMALLEVSLPGGYGADAQLLYSQLHQSGSLLRRIELTPTNTRATFYLGTRDGSDPSGSGGHQCYNIHAVGPRTKTRPAYARVQDYYVPEHNDTQIFTIPEDCPSRIVHDAESSQYRPTDNLFSKAKSLDGDEILISHDFFFDDIPDGIPLEDPLYDNLTKREKEEIETEIETIDDFNTNKEDKDEFDNIELHTIESDDMEATDTSNIKSDTHDNNLDKFTLNNVASLNNTNKANNLYSNIDIEELSNIKNENNTNVASVNYTKNEMKREEITPIKTLNKNIVSQPISVLPTEDKTINPNLADFHIIDTDKDLDVPSGVEGPIPTVVLPPINFIPPKRNTKRLRTQYTPHGPYYYFKPEVENSRIYFTPARVNRRYFSPRETSYKSIR